MKPIEKYLEELSPRLAKLEREKRKEYASLSYSGEQDDDTIAIDAIAHATGDISPARIAIILGAKHYISMLCSIDKYSVSKVREKLDDIHIFSELAFKCKEKAEDSSQLTFKDFLRRNKKQ